MSHVDTRPQRELELFYPAPSWEPPKPLSFLRFKLRDEGADYRADPVAQAHEYVERGHSVAKGHEHGDLELHFDFRLGAGWTNGEPEGFCALL